MTEFPAPVTDRDSEPFFAALRREVVVVQECEGCGRRRVDRLDACPWCGTPGGHDVEVDGTGEVYSYVRVQRALTPAMADETPYAIATVELDGGGRVFGRVEPAEIARIGLRVAPRFVDHGDWTELRFTPES